MRVLSIYIFLFFFVSIKIYGQTIPKEDTSPSISLADSTTADSLYNLGKKYEITQNYENAIKSFKSSLSIYQNIGNYKKTGDCFSYIGFVYLLQGDYPKSLIFYEKGLETYKKVKYKKGVSQVLSNTGGIYYYYGNYPKALEYYKQAVSILEETGDKKGLALTISNIGGIYFKLGDNTNAMKYYNQGYLFFKKINDENEIARSLNSIGLIYVSENKYEKALEKLYQSLTLADKVKDKPLKTEVLSGLGELFYKQSNFQKSLNYFNQCLVEAKKINSLRYESISQISIGKIMHKLSQNKDAIEKCKKGLTMAEKMKANALKKSGCECLYESYKSLGNSFLALQYYEKANILKDSLKLEETSNRIINMEFQRKQLIDSIATVQKEQAIQVKHREEVQKKEQQRNIIIISLVFVLLTAGVLWNRLNFVRKSRAELKKEKDRSEALLLNILPEEIAEELKEKGSVNAREFNLVSILFSDFKSFTQTAEKMTPQTLVEEINVCFKAFDLIAEKYQVEKIKTIGDAYMAAGGIPVPSEDSLKNIVLAGLEMQAFMIERAKENEKSNLPFFEMRLGIHAGPIVAGIVGVKKFQYDVWGDTVNTASRIESNGMVGKVNISETLYQLIKHEPCFKFEYRGNINAKGKGEIAMYFVEKKENS